MLNNHYWNIRNSRTATYGNIDQPNHLSHWEAGFFDWHEDLKEKAKNWEGEAPVHSDLPYYCTVDGVKFQYQFTDWLDKANGCGSHWYKKI